MANEFKVKNGVKFPDNSIQTTAGLQQDNIKTVNSTSLIGTTDITLFSGGLVKIEKVATLPASPDANTLYIVTG
jgi:hypothetical protein